MPSSDYIDERVVEMKIDNRQFIDGANRTISVLDKLKSALSFREAGNGFADIQRSADKFDLSGIAADVEQISSRFSTLGIIGARVIQGLTDKIVNFVEATVKGFTIDPIMQGWQQYEEYLKSTRTILAATREEDFSKLGYGTQLEYVNDQLDRLMWYTDETSYKFSDMVSNIGKFTNAGIPLERAVIDMQGITNWAGLSGASIQEASRAMYNLSQAIAVGSVKLMDWRSIENANMATLEFKQTAIDTAVAAGRLTKVGEGLYKTTQGNTVSAQNFTQALSDGWFNAEVLEKTLAKFGDFSRVLNETMQDLSFIENGITATDVLGWVEDIEKGEKSIQDWHDALMEELGDEDLVPHIEALEYAFKTLTDQQLALGRRAFVASQEYKTLTDALDATGDAVRTGWTKSFSYITGDAEQAKKVWTAVGDELYDIFAEAGNRRNAILKLWSQGSSGTLVNGRDSLLRGLANLYKGIRTYVDPIVEGFNRVFSWGKPEEAANKLRELTLRFERFTQKIALSDDAVKGMSNAFEIVFKWIKNVAASTKPFFKAIGTAIGYIKRFVEVFFESFSEGSFDKNKFLSGASELLGELSEKFTKARTSAEGFFSGIVNSTAFATVKGWLSSIISFFVSAFNSAKTFFTSIGDTVQIVWGYIKDFFTSIKENMSSAFSSKSGVGITNILKAIGAIFLLKKGAGAFSWIKDIFSLFKPVQSLLSNINGAFESLGDALSSFSKKSAPDDLKKIAIAVGILTVALVVLASVDAKKLGIALSVMAGGMLELVGAMKGLEFISGKKGKNATKGLTSLAVSVLILSFALKVLAGIKAEALMDALGAVFVLLAEILVFLEAINLMKIKPKSIKGLTSLAISMLIFTGVVYLMGSIPYDKLKQGLISLALALLIVSVAMVAISKFGGVKALAAGAGMILLATSLIILAGAVALFSLLDVKTIGTALAILAMSLLIVAAAVLMMPATLPLIAAGLIGVVIAIGLLSAVLIVLSKFDFDALLGSVLLLIIALGGIAAVMAIMSGFIVGAAALLIVSVAFVVAAGAFIVFALALKLVADLPLTDIALGLLAVGGALIVLAIGLAVMTVGIIGAVVLGLTAVGLIALSAALKLFEGTDIVGISGGLAVLGLALIPLGLGGLVLMLGVPGLTAGAAAIALMAVALVPFAFALKQLEGISFTTMVEYLLLLGGTAGVLALLTPILGPLGIAVAAFGVSCLAAGAGIDLAGSGMMKIADSITGLPDNLGKTFKNAAKEIADSVFEFKPSGEQVVAAVTEIGNNMALAVTQANTNIGGVLTRSISANLSILSQSVASFRVGGANIVVGIANGIYSQSSTVVTAMHTLALAMIKQFQEDFEIHSPSRLMESMTSNIPLGAARGVNQTSGVAVSAVDSFADKMIDSMRSAMETVYTLADNDFSISPVISPVVDMTGVTDSANSISSMLSGSAEVSGRVSQINRSISDLENLAADMQTISEARANTSQDTYEINIYPTPDMDEEAVADAVLDRLSSGVVRRGAALG